MAKEKLVEIAKLLLENTKAGNVRWEKTSKKGQFQTPFAKYTILLAGPSAVPDLFLCDEDGDIVEDFTYMAAIDAGLLETMKELYELARRRALGADDALDEIVNILRSSAGDKK
jgi:hypothetical protein